MSLTNTPDVTVNNRLISAQQIDAEIQYHPAATRREAMIKATESLIIGELLKQRAESLGLAFSHNQPASESQYEDALLSQLIAQEVTVPSAQKAECEHFYQQNKAKFTSAPLLEVDHILLASDPADLIGRENTKSLAQSLISQLQQQHEVFAELAAVHSACPSKQTGGNLGQISSGQTVPEFEKTIFAANEGLIEFPVESRFGHHVVFIRRKVAGKQLPFELVQQDIEAYLNEKVKQKAISQYIQILINDANIDGFSFSEQTSPLVQ